MPDFTMRCKSYRRLLISLVLCLSMGSCAKRESNPSAQILRISQRNEPATLDPQLATLPDEFFIIRALSEGLLVPNPAGGAPLPGVAERWEASADGLSWTFHLRANSRWSNGDPVTAADFVSAIGRVRNPATPAPKAPLFAALQQATAPDARTLVLHLKQVTPDLPSLAASGPWIPVHLATVAKHGPAWTRPGNFVGNGPFTLAEWSPNQRLIVRKNPNYWDAAAVQLDEIQFLAFDNGDTEERAFRAGQVDVTMGVPVAKLDSYQAASPAVLHTVPLHETRYLALNTARPPLNDVRVRRALSLALDRRILADKVLKGGQRPAYTLVPAGLGGYTPAPAVTEDRDEARRLLAAAGFPGGKNFPKLELSTWGASTTVLEAIQQAWRAELGVEIGLLQREARTHLAALAAGDYDLGFATAIPDYDSAGDVLSRLVSGQAENYPHWSNATYDRLVSAHRLQDAEKLLLDEMPVIPLYFNAKNFLLRPAVHGWREDALWTRYYKNVSLHE